MLPNTVQNTSQIQVTTISLYIIFENTLCNTVLHRKGKMFNSTKHEGQHLKVVIH